MYDIVLRWDRLRQDAAFTYMDLIKLPEKYKEMIQRSLFPLDLSIFAKKFCMNNIGITKRKNADYTGGGDPFKNFKQVQEYGVLPFDGFITRMTDKFARINTGLVKELQVKDESLTDTLRDLANYSMLMGGYVLKVTDLVQYATEFYDGVCSLLPADGQSLTSVRKQFEAAKLHFANSIEIIRQTPDGTIKSIPPGLLKIALCSLLIAYQIENMDINGAQ